MKGKAATGLMVGLLSLILTACTVVDLDANGNPIMPKDPNAKPGYSNQTPQQIAESSWASRVQQPAEKQALSWADMETKSHTVKAGAAKAYLCVPEEPSPPLITATNATQPDRHHQWQTGQGVDWASAAQ
jgi:Predicted periplasmic lipoprotein